MILSLATVALTLLLALTAQASSSSECASLVGELQAMRKAQNEIIVSLASNHETFAVSVEEITMELELYSKKVPAKALKSMNKTGQAFRARGVQGKKMAEKLNEATADLIERVTACLKK